MKITQMAVTLLVTTDTTGLFSELIVLCFK